MIREQEWEGGYVGGGEKKGKRKEKSKRKNKLLGWWGKKGKKKEKKKKRGRGNILRQQRGREEYNGKIRYFGSCEKNK